MKTAAKFLTTALTAALGLGLAASPDVVLAQAAKDPGPITSTVPGPASPSTPAKAGALPSSLDLPVLDKGKETKGKADKDDKGDIPAPSPKVPDSVKSVIKKLNTATQDVTLDDLNSAREAVVKLDVLIDIEKRLNDLTTLRLEREEKNATSLAAALPASALGLPSKSASKTAAPMLPLAPMMEPVSMPKITTSVAPKAVLAPPVQKEPNSVDVVRISGARGSYAATIKETDGKTKQVRQGDKLSDGSLVTAVSREGVTLSLNSKTKTLPVKGSPQVFGEH